MAITKELLTENESLKDLNEDQIKAITELSSNDEKEVVKTSVGKHHGLIDKDVNEISGLEKEEGEKSYEYMKRAMNHFKSSGEKAEGLQTEIADQKTKIQDLQTKIDEGSEDKATLQKLKDTQSKLDALQDTHETEKSDYQKKIDDLNGRMAKGKINTEFGKALSSMKFKSVYPESVQKTLIDSAKSNILNKYKTDNVEVEGETVMVFRDQDGEIIRNKSNGLNPYTASELLKNELKDTLDTGRKQGGSGSSSGSGSGSSEVIDVSQAKTRVEADSLISKHLMSIGLTRGSRAFADKQKEIRTENDVSSLPLS